MDGKPTRSSEQRTRVQIAENLDEQANDRMPGACLEVAGGQNAGALGYSLGVVDWRWHKGFGAHQVILCGFETTMYKCHPRKEAFK
jgi:hypothetical protein